MQESGTSVMSAAWFSLRWKKKKKTDLIARSRGPEKELSAFPGFHEGFQVMSVANGSPAHKAGLIPFFDIILAVNETFFFPSYKKEGREFFLNYLQSHLDTPVSLLVLNTKVLATRHILLTPNRKWGEPGILGCSVCWSTELQARSKCMHVVDVAEDSPARGLLKGERDYIVGYRQSWEQHTNLVENERTLQLTVQEALLNKQSKKKVLFFLVYNKEENSLKEIMVSIPLSGRVGVAVAHGAAHLIATGNKHDATNSELEGPLAAPTAMACCCSKNCDQGFNRVDGIPYFEPFGGGYLPTTRGPPSLHSPEEKRESKEPSPTPRSPPVCGVVVEASVESLYNFAPGEFIEPNSDLSKPSSLPYQLSITEGKPNECEDSPLNPIQLPSGYVGTPDEGDVVQHGSEGSETIASTSISPSLSFRSVTGVKKSVLRDLTSSAKCAGDDISRFDRQSSPPEFNNLLNDLRYKDSASLAHNESENIRTSSRSLSNSKMERNMDDKQKIAESISLMDPVQFYLTEPGFVPIPTPPPTLFPLHFSLSHQIPIETPYASSLRDAQPTNQPPVINAFGGTHLPLSTQTESSIPNNAVPKYTISSSTPETHEEVEKSLLGGEKQSLSDPLHGISDHSDTPMIRKVEEFQEPVAVEITGVCGESTPALMCSRFTVPSPLHFPLHDEVMKYRDKF